MLPIFLEMKQERSPKRYKRWRSEGLSKAPFVMTEVLEATAWYNSFRFYLEIFCWTLVSGWKFHALQICTDNT
jgi:hypothetical protein